MWLTLTIARRGGRDALTYNSSAEHRPAILIKLDRLQLTRIDQTISQAAGYSTQIKERCLLDAAIFSCNRYIDTDASILVDSSAAAHPPENIVSLLLYTFFYENTVVISVLDRLLSLCLWYHLHWLLSSYSRSSKVSNLSHLKTSMRVINGNLDPILHRLATVHPWQTDRRTTLMPIDRPLLRYSRLKQTCFRTNGESANDKDDT